MSFVPLVSEHPTPIEPGQDWEATVYERVVQFRFNTTAVTLPREQALRLAHAIFAAYGVSGTLQ